MEKIINLPNAEAVREFVDDARMVDDIVLVSKEGYRMQIDGASILGMMSVIGVNIRVSLMSGFDCFKGIFEKYGVA